MLCVDDLAVQERSDYFFQQVKAYIRLIADVVEYLFPGKIVNFLSTIVDLFKEQ